MQQSPKTFGWKWQLTFFIVVFVEVYYMFQYSSTYGVMSLLTLILGSIVLGIILMRWEGSICWKRILYMNRRNMPATNEMRDGVLILFAGILMIIPGIITDVLGLLLFLPPVRWIVRKLFLQNLYFEIPPGMETQFKMYSFSSSNQSNDNQNDSYNTTEGNSSEEFAESRQEPFDRNPDIQIIDVKATDPKEPSRVIDSQKREENKEKTNAESQESDD